MIEYLKRMYYFAKRISKLVNEVKRIASVYDCGLAMKAVIKFREGLDDDLNKANNLLVFQCKVLDHLEDKGMDAIAYLADPCTILRQMCA